MAKTLIIFLIFWATSMNALIFSQSKIQMQQVIKVEVTFQEEAEIKREIEIPISEKGFGVGGRTFCAHCDDKFGEYEFNAGV